MAEIVEYLIITDEGINYQRFKRGDNGLQQNHLQRYEMCSNKSPIGLVRIEIISTFGISNHETICPVCPSL